VRNTQNGREVIVRINDRGPHVHDRIIDLSKAAAEALDMVQAGQAPVILIVP
jgi:rare lipoprotein A